MMRKSRMYLIIFLVGFLVSSKLSEVDSHGHSHGGSNDHGHVHSHSHAGHGHGHAHDHGHGHGHAHDHGHGHGHAHDHGHGHGHAHDHGHAHSHESNEANPAYKYSRAANEKPATNEPQNNHVHSHSKSDEDRSHSQSSSHHQHQNTPPKVKREGSGQSTNSAAPIKIDKFKAVIQATVSTLVISIAPFLLLFFIPLNENNPESMPLLKKLLAFASGSLLGDAFLHLIPHALSPHDEEGGHSHSHSHSHGDQESHHDHSAQTSVGLWVLGGILTFLFVEKLIMALNTQGEHGHTHSHDKKKDEKTKVSEKKSDEKKSDEKKSDVKKEVEKKEGEIKIGGYLNLAADFAHNFTDGLAIGASYLAGQNIGLITTLTILIHEVPHEIGDFALLIQAGCSKKKAIFLQLVTAIGALSGTLLSLLFETAVSGFATGCILPFTAGGFIYIALVTIIPELKEDSTFKQSLIEILLLILGILMMVLIAYLE